MKDNAYPIKKGSAIGGISEPGSDITELSERLGGIK